MTIATSMHVLRFMIGSINATAVFVISLQRFVCLRV